MLLISDAESVSVSYAEHRLQRGGRRPSASVLSRVTLDNPLAPLGERVASAASRVRGGSAESMIVKNYAGPH